MLFQKCKRFLDSKTFFFFQKIKMCKVAIQLIFENIISQKINICTILSKNIFNFLPKYIKKPQTEAKKC